MTSPLHALLARSPHGAGRRVLRAGRSVPFVRATLAAVAIAIAILGSPPARADTVVQVFTWPRWQRGLDLGLRAAGHFGRGSSLNSPPGDFIIEAGYHIWFRHLFELHGVLGYGISNGTFVYGIGAKLNLMEYLRDPTGRTRASGIQRGLASTWVQDFMVYFGLDYRHYGFKAPTPPAVYPTSVWTMQPSVGAQFYFNIKTEWARRFYFELSGAYTTIESNNVLLPYAGFGVELR